MPEGVGQEGKGTRPEVVRKGRGPEVVRKGRGPEVVRKGRGPEVVMKGRGVRGQLHCNTSMSPTV